MSNAQFNQRKPLTRRFFQLSVKANGVIAMSSDIGNDVPQYTVTAMKIPTLVAILVFVSISAFSQNSKLPKPAGELEAKLVEWEKEQKRNYDTLIQKQRQKVIQALQSHLTSATKNNDLDGAIAIRELIVRLKSEYPPTETEVEPEAKHPKIDLSGFTKREFEKWLGTVEFSKYSENDYEVHRIEDDKFLTFRGGTLSGVQSAKIHKEEKSWSVEKEATPIVIKIESESSAFYLIANEKIKLWIRKRK